MEASDRPEFDALFEVPRDRLTEISFRVDGDLDYEPGLDIVAHLRQIDRDRITQLSTRLREGVGALARNGWSDKYSQKTPDSWREQWKDQRGEAIPWDRIPGGGLDHPGPSFDRPGDQAAQ